MPIRADQKGLYPANWQDLRREILLRAEDCCEWCGKPNGETVLVDACGCWMDLSDPFFADIRHVPTALPEIWETEYGKSPDHVVRPVKVVLTVAHLDHDPTHNHPMNLRALCQKCHNSYDAWRRALGRKERLNDASTPQTD